MRHRARASRRIRCRHLRRRREARHRPCTSRTLYRSGRRRGTGGARRRRRLRPPRSRPRWRPRPSRCRPRTCRARRGPENVGRVAVPSSSTGEVTANPSIEGATLSTMTIASSVSLSPSLSVTRTSTVTDVGPSSPAAENIGMAPVASSKTESPSNAQSYVSPAETSSGSLEPVASSVTMPPSSTL